jgi:hypothetical protein
MRGLRAALFAIALSLAGTALASGSFSARLDVDQLRLELNLEQEVTQVSGWTVYAGSGFSVSRAGVEKLQPYTLACWGTDLGFAYGEVCGELRAPLIGDGNVLTVYTTVAW